MISQMRCACGSRGSIVEAAGKSRLPLRRLPLGRATPDNDAQMPGVMTHEKACAVLGVHPSASFEDVVTAKNRLIGRDKSNSERLMEIETAYDVLFMQNMKKRLTGELEVSTSVRYADVPAPAKKSPSRSSASPPSSRPSLPKLSTPTGLSVSLQPPRNTNVAVTQSAIFGGLAVWALLQAILQTPDSQLAETAGFPLALALGYSIYSLKENKGMQLGKAAGCTMACLLGGALMGNLVEAWLRVDIVPILGFSSPGTLVAEFIIAACATGAIFLV